MGVFIPLVSRMALFSETAATYVLIVLEKRGAIQLNLSPFLTSIQWPRASRGH